ncbi:hypothetical protein [Erythrobacter oryzae]|uniref:hypothetical protein n=1 Tax=Erythrobacter oryzae TaxID=3019556 RepID=UPI00255329E9|nr:hypothetical protein [Erythrobacter sp. COR-2]
MLAIMELFLDAQSIGQDIRRDREENRRRRGGRMRVTYGLLIAVVLIVLAVFKLF